MTTKKKTKTKRGGKRTGAGRKEGSTTTPPKKAVTVRLVASLYAKLGDNPTARATELLTEALEKEDS